MKYFIHFTFKDKLGSGDGNCSMTRFDPLCNMDEIKDIESDLKRTLGHTSVVVTNWRRFEQMDDSK